MMRPRRLALLCGLFVVAAGAERAFGQQVDALLADCDKFYEAEEFKKSAACYDRAINIAPTQVRAEVYAKRATIFVVEKKLEAGVTWIETVAEKVYPGHVLLLEQKAVMLSKLPGRREQSVQLAEEVARKKPDSYSAHIIVAEFYYQAGAGSAAKAAAAYEAYLLHRPGEFADRDGLYRVKLGYSYLHLAEYKKADGQFEEVLRRPGKVPGMEANARKGRCAALAGLREWDSTITLCERVIRDRRALRGDASPHYNLGQAYVEKKRWEDALGAANSYIGQKPNDARGYLLRGKVYLGQGKLNEAEGQLMEALKRDPSGTNIEIPKTLGEVYNRQKRPERAVQVLERVLEKNPDDAEVLRLTVDSYRTMGQPRKGIVHGERLLKLKPHDVVYLKPVAAAYYDAGELGQARAIYTKALSIKRDDREASGGLVDTIVRQAHDKFQQDDLAAAELLLKQAYDVDPESLSANFNLGLIAIENGKHADAVKYLTVRLKKAPDDLLTNRLIAKAYLNSGNEQKAAEHYARAENEAKKLRNNRVLAEIYVEWAPILIKGGKLEEAVEKLEIAAQYASGQAFEPAAARNLQLAYFRRGVERLRAGKRNEALEDLDAAYKNPSLLDEKEKAVFHFALGLAYLAAGQEGKALPIFQDFAKKPALAFLKPPFDKIGAELFTAYAWYREGSVASRLKAAAIFEKLVGKVTGGLQARLKELLRSAWEFAAYEQFVAGKVADAAASLKKADAFAAGGSRKTIEHNLAVLDMVAGRGNPGATFERLGGDPPEALVNMGIVAEKKGDPRKAYNLWTQARARGVKFGKLDDWIEAKKRIFGY